MADFRTSIAKLRRQRRHRDVLLHSANEMLEFINLVGFCLLLPHPRLHLPNLSDVSCGRFRQWRDELMVGKQIYYGRPLRRRAGFVALRLLPSLYALSPTAKYDGDRFQLFQNRFLSADANRITGIVLAKGPLSTRSLRRESGLAGDAHRWRLLRALAEAESRFLIAKMGIGRLEGARYTYLWNAFPRFLPDVPYRASGLRIEDAARQVITHYVDLVGAAAASEIAVTFGLNLEFVSFMFQQLASENSLMTVTRGDMEYLVSPELRSELAK